MEQEDRLLTYLIVMVLVLIFILAGVAIWGYFQFHEMGLLYHAADVVQ